MLSLVIIITVLYVVLIVVLCIGFSKMPAFKLTAETPQYRFSIIIPFRNEVNNLPRLLESLQGLHYPKNRFEIILVDDASEDVSAEIVSQFIKTSDAQISLITSAEKSSSPKKEALQKGIKQSSYEWIVTTDADCMVPENWLKAIDGFIQQHQPKMVVAPVFLTQTKNHALEAIEILGLQLMTLGSFGLGKPLLNNGANLAFKKKCFLRVEGYSGNTHLASGDDLFLMEKFVQQNYKVSYLKSRDAIVLTKPQDGFLQLVQQRVRWASKTTASKNWCLKFCGILISLMNILLSVLFVLVLFGLFNWQSLLIFFIIKTAADLLAVILSSSFFKEKQVLLSFIWTSLVYPFLNTYIFIRSLFGGYQWKGRRFKR